MISPPLVEVRIWKVPMFTLYIPVDFVACGGVHLISDFLMGFIPNWHSEVRSLRFLQVTTSMFLYCLTPLDSTYLTDQLPIPECFSIQLRLPIELLNVQRKWDIWSVTIDHRSLSTASIPFLDGSGREKSQVSWLHPLHPPKESVKMEVSMGKSGDGVIFSIKCVSLRVFLSIWYYLLQKVGWAGRDPF